MGCCTGKEGSNLREYYERKVRRIEEVDKELGEDFRMCDRLFQDTWSDITDHTDTAQFDSTSVQTQNKFEDNDNPSEDQRTPSGALTRDYISDILWSIETGDDQLRGEFLDSLRSLLTKNNPKIAKAVIKLDGFRALLRWLSCSDPKLRMISIEICYLLYRNSKSAQDEFVKLKGHIMLVQLLSLSVGNESETAHILNYINGLIFCRNKKIRTEICQELLKAMVWEVLTSISKREMTVLVSYNLNTIKSALAESVILVR